MRFKVFLPVTKVVERGIPLSGLRGELPRGLLAVLLVSSLLVNFSAVVVAQDAVLDDGATALAEAPGRAPNLPDGINDAFLDPEMKVEDYIKRFETESREVFACRHQILKAIQLQPGMEVADVGSGTGLYLGPLSQGVTETGKVYAVDIAPQFVKHLRQRAKHEGLDNVRVVLCSDHDVNLKPNSIDRVFICDVYHHFEYPEASLKSIYEAMKDDAKLILVDFHREVEGDRKEWLMGHIRAPQSVFKQEFIDAGFKFEEEVKIDGFKENYLLRFGK
ncbi:class I SAM-dependent methyltransferase [Aureliella helgolandensis]|uniref:Methyltransferase type 11 domain-containing protein n=1 Tax=Aureliella helgolandensis TaxID=2527968 RepID=A0A518GHD2_9BACT|nr:class I SAM-dependent methyltransferase [Aureliella helgolandensis]QDV27993.1 hypothetical protein Q31a_63860 [Aureliella helgolandensis]